MTSSTFGKMGSKKLLMTTVDEGWVGALQLLTELPIESVTICTIEAVDGQRDDASIADLGYNKRCASGRRLETRDSRKPRMMRSRRDVTGVRVHGRVSTRHAMVLSRRDRDATKRKALMKRLVT